MTIRATFTTLASVTLGSAVLLAAAPAVRFDDGYLVTMKVSTDQQPTNITFKVAGEKVRIETDITGMMGGGRGGAGGGGGGGMGAMAEGAFMLPQAGGKLAVIIPNSPMGPMGLVIDGAVIGGGGGGRGRGMGGVPQADMTDVSVTVDDMGNAESILGHSTHKYKLHRKFTQNGTAHDETEEMWMSTDFPGAEKAFAKVGSMFGQNAGELADAVMAKMPKGVPLRIISTRGTSVSTVEVVDVKKSTFEAAEFEVPPGVQLMDMGAIMGGRRGGGNR